MNAAVFFIIFAAMFIGEVIVFGQLISDYFLKPESEDLNPHWRKAVRNSMGGTLGLIVGTGIMMIVCGAACFLNELKS
jgi:hypothetical protein